MNSAVKHKFFSETLVSAQLLDCDVKLLGLLRVVDSMVCSGYV